MTLEYSSWSGGWESHDGTNTYPYKVDSSDPLGLHEAREQNVHAGEANDPRNYEELR